MLQLTRNIVLTILCLLVTGILIQLHHAELEARQIDEVKPTSTSSNRNLIGGQIETAWGVSASVPNELYWGQILSIDLYAAFKDKLIVRLIRQDALEPTWEQEYKLINGRNTINLPTENFLPGFYDIVVIDPLSLEEKIYQLKLTL